jgi:hypothetical protein
MPSELDDEQLRRVLAEINAILVRNVPGWADKNASDPGITLVELLAWIADGLTYRLGKLPADEHRALMKAVDRLLTARPHSCASFDGLVRPNYFVGKLLTADDFQAEQDYLREKSRRANRCLAGSGIVSGLTVTVDADSATTDVPEIVVEPGCAIDPRGEELAVCVSLRCKLRAIPPAGFVVLRYAEREITPTLTLQADVLDEAGMKMGRVEEGVAVAFEHEVTGFDVALARLKQEGDMWRIDTTFQRLVANHCGDHNR